MTGHVVHLEGNRHRCLPDSWSSGAVPAPEAAYAPMGSVWACDCGRTWKRAPRPFTGEGQRLVAPYWRRERFSEKIWRALCRR